MLVRAYVGEGDNVVVCRPTFPLYEISARRCGGEPVYADMDAEFAYDAATILSAIDKRTRIVFLCTPNNPSGTLLKPQLAARLVDEIPERVLIVIDESYRLFVADESNLVDSIGYALSRPNVASLRSFSKAYGLAGLRIGYAIAPPEVATYVQRLRHPFHSSNLALQGAIAALGDEEYVNRVRQTVLEERDWLSGQLADIDLEVIPSQANFVAARAAYPSQLIYERLLPKGVIIRPLAFFYLPDWFRVTIGTREENMRLIEVLKEELQAMAQEGISTEHEAGDGKVAV